MLDIHRRNHFSAIVGVWLLAIGVPASAQTPPAPTAAAAPPAAADPLGRDSPFGTVTGFRTAVGRDDFTVAARYMQTERRGPQQIESLARDLSDLLDRYFTQRLTSVSHAPAGDLADGLDPNRERILLEIGDREADILLTRVKDPNAGLIWLISSESLTRVPALRRSEAATWVERVMPASLVARSYAGLSLAQWVLWAASILAPLLVFSTLAGLTALVARRRITDVTRRTLFLSSWRGLRWPIVLGLTLLAHLAVVPQLGFSVTSRYDYSRWVLAVGVIIAAFLIWRLVAVAFTQARLLAIRRGRASARSLIQLGERVAKVLVVLITMFALLALGGVDPTTALAGVGIVGVAVALGAQKSVENLIGGVSLLTDHALAVGDYCRLSDREGWIEDITLRSVRLRTLEQTLLSVPAGQLAQGSIENFVSRNKILLQSVLRLRYGTTCAQLRVALDGIRRLLAEHPSIDHESARVRLIAFGAQAIELELFAYVTTPDYGTFLEVRENVLLQVANVVESSGGAFAIPTQFIYLRNEADQHQQWLAHPS
jgi:MscS family membrane protein